MKISMEKMNKDNREKTIKEKVLEQIKHGEVSMRPRWHFILKASLGIFGVVFVLLVVVYLVSFVFFILRVTGVLFVPAFGLRALGPFFFSLPWLLIGAAGAFIVVLEVVARKYAFAYRTPLLYLFVGTIALVALSSFVFARIGLHDRLFQFAQEGKVPFVAPMYRGYALHGLEEIHSGIISTSTVNGFRIISSQGETIEVVVSSRTRFPRGFDLIEGDEIVVLGTRSEDTIEAFGIRGFSKEGPRMMGGRGWRMPFTPPLQ